MSQTTRQRPHRLASWLMATLVAGTSGIDHAPPPDNPTVAPVPRLEADWLERHEGFVAVARRGGVDLLFLGDSIVEFWGSFGSGAWSRYYEPRRAANFGIGGDHTQHLLWRLDHGELEGINPRVVVLMIGTNNLPQDSEDHVLDGIEAVIGRLRLRLPGSKILLLGVTPRALDPDPRQVTTAPDPRVPRLNARVARLADGRAIRYLEFGPALLDAQGRLVQATQPDFLHLGGKAYQTWAEAMEPSLREMLGEQPDHISKIK